MEATASTRSPSTWYLSSQNRALLIEETLYLVAAVIEDTSCPSPDESLSGIRVFIEVRPVKIPRPCSSLGKWEGTQSRITPMPCWCKIVDQVHEVLGCPVTAGGGEVPDCLISPGAVKWVLHDRQKLNVGETHLLDIFSQL